MGLISHAKIDKHLFSGNEQTAKFVIFRVIHAYIGLMNCTFLNLKMLSLPLFPVLWSLQMYVLVNPQGNLCIVLNGLYFFSSFCYIINDPTKQ